MDSSLWMLLLALVVCSAFFSSAEAAILSANKVRLMNLQEEGNKKAGLVLYMLDEQSRVLSTILVGNNLANIAASSLATKVALDLWGNIGLGLATGVMTLIILIVGEVIPKNLASGKANSWAIFISPLLRALMILLFPAVWILSAISNLVLKLSKLSTEDPLITEDELRLLVSAGQEEGFLDENETEMINSIFEFDDTTVKEIMVPRIDMIAINGEDSLEEALSVILKCGHSRIPVYSGTVDNIIGILYAKDLLKAVGSDLKEDKTKDWLRSGVYYIPENKNVSDLLAEMRKKKMHMAIILDEYGGTAGLITIEDLIEEIIGDIQDEFDAEEEWIVPQADGLSVIADARALVYDVAEALDVELDENADSDTIGGVVFDHVGAMPKVGDEAEFEQLHMRVAEVNGHRVSKVEVRVIPQEKEEEQEDWFYRQPRKDHDEE